MFSRDRLLASCTRLRRRLLTGKFSSVESLLLGLTEKTNGEYQNRGVRLAGLSWPANQARAAFQSRLTVIVDTPSTSATWSSSKPPKNRNSTTCAARGSSVANFD